MGRRNEGFLDGASGGPAEEVEERASLVVGTRGPTRGEVRKKMNRRNRRRGRGGREGAVPSTAEGLLSYDGASWLIVDVEITGRIHELILTI